MPSHYALERLSPGAAATVTFPYKADSVVIASDGTADVFYTVDGTTATLAGSKIAAGVASDVGVNTPVAVGGTHTRVSVISAGSPLVSIARGAKGFPRPPRQTAVPSLDF